MNSYEELLAKVRTIAEADLRSEDKMQAVTALLAADVEGFDCVAFFLIDPDNPRQLLIGPRSGAGLTPTHIAIGQGICGQVAEHAITIVVDDVTQELNYLPGHPDTRSEIVLPVFRSGQVVAELDVNSFQFARFQTQERLFLEELCLLLTDRI
ncbi:MAG: GAF domain-containing protein [Candidatus Latescibacteria bacterium]|nr:GAF domain-containing protein [Candidatus Latescibacterota bacterium]